jgi:hypothetical protein
MEFVQARFFTPASRGVGDIERLVFHTGELGETRASAENLASFFKNLSASTPVSRRVSAHKCFDSNSVVMCVRNDDIANHAAGDNLQTIGYEMSGFAGQTKAQWGDNFSTNMIELVCEQAAADCFHYDLPVRWLTDAQLARREKGLVTHDAVSRVFGDDIRNDPGPHFPYGKVEARIEQLVKQMVKVEFVIRDEGDSKDLVVSRPVRNERSARIDRLDSFLEAGRLRLLDSELKEDGKVILKVRKAKEA